MPGCRDRAGARTAAGRAASAARSRAARASRSTHRTRSAPEGSGRNRPTRSDREQRIDVALVGDEDRDRDRGQEEGQRGEGGYDGAHACSIRVRPSLPSLPNKSLGEKHLTGHRRRIPQDLARVHVECTCFGAKAPWSRQSWPETGRKLHCHRPLQRVLRAWGDPRGGDVLRCRGVTCFGVLVQSRRWRGSAQSAGVGSPYRSSTLQEARMHCRRHGLHCVLPPIILENIARRGDDEQREWATRALSCDHSIRLARVQNSRAGVAPTSQRADALVGVSQPRPARVISDAQGTENVRGPIVRREGDPATGDVAADQAYDGLGDTFEFWLEAYGRNSIDDAGMPLRGVVHFGDQYPNAFWDGQRMVFGDGDGQVLGVMTGSLDVIGHELGHGVTENEAGLEYWGQSGAMNESLSDVFGSLVKQYKLHQDAASADWLIGREVVDAERRRRRAPLDEGARHGVRRPAGRQGPAAGPHGRLRRDRSRTTAASTSTRGFRTAPSTSRPPRSAATRGRSAGGSGTRRCAIRRCAPTPASRPSRGSQSSRRSACRARAAPRQRQSRTPGTLWASRPSSPRCNL